MSSLGSTITEADLSSVPFSNDTPSKFLYVSAGSTGGNGTIDHPFGTIQAAVSIATPGTAVMVEAGTYVENVKFPSQAGGTADAPIWLVSSDGPGAAKVIPADSTVSTIKGLGVHNIVVEGFAVQGGLNGIQFSQSGLDLQHTVANIVVQGNIIYDTLQDAVKISQADNVWVLNNTVHNAGDQATDFVSTTNSVIAYNASYNDTGPAVIFAKGGSGNVLIAHNLIDGAVADGLEIGGWAVGSNYQPVYTNYEATNVTAVDNVVMNVAKRPLNVLGAVNSDIHNNFFQANPNYMTAINVGPGFDPLRVAHDDDIHDNTISHAGTTQIQVQTGSNNAIAYHDNVLSDVNNVQAGTIAYSYWNGGLAVAAGAGSGVVLSPLPPPVVPPGTLVLNGTNHSDILIGQGSSNQIYGGLGNDKLYGGSGDDTLDGGNGVDTLYGGAGNDTYVVDGPNDVIVEQPDGGIDTVKSGMNGFHIDGYANVENAVFTGSGAVNMLGNGLDNVLVAGAGDDTLDGGAGADTLVGGDGNDIYLVHDGRTQIIENANSGIDTVRSDVSFVLPSNVENLLLTNPGLTGVGNELDNAITGSAGGDSLYGGAGNDTAVFSGFIHDYTVSAVGGQAVISGGPEGGVSTLTSIENAQFLDGVLTFDPEGDAAKILRLYDGFLGRAPDTAGLEGYLKFVADGHTLADMAANAFNSPEFQAHTASLTDSQFVDYVYETSLHRHADAGGLASYVTGLEDGTFTRASLILQAAESPEHVALLGPELAAGVWEPNQTVEALELLYDGAVQRQPDASGIAGYSALIASGTTYKEIANQMANSAEFLGVHGAQTDAEFVDSLYVATVGRHADAFGLAAYTDELAHGFTRGDVLFQMSLSQEHQSHVLGAFDPLLLNLV